MRASFRLLIEGQNALAPALFFFKAKNIKNQGENRLRYAVIIRSHRRQPLRTAYDIYTTSFFSLCIRV